ncbi:transcription termination factor, mitochondrial [Euwallacea similis]|uniref:transcription termination factor, mitochondrial n=1 Tax=Euwallacea similis TaxID=1736056 RepID=UPI003450A2D4
MNVVFKVLRNRGVFANPLSLIVHYASTSEKLAKNVNLPTQPNFYNIEENADILKLAKSKIQNILSMQEADAMTIVSSNKKLLTTPSYLIKQNSELCKEKGLTGTVFMKYPFLLSEACLLKKLDSLQKLPISLETSIPLARLSINRINEIGSERDDIIKRIKDLVRIFGVTQEEACDILSKKSFLIFKNIEDIQEMLKFYYGYGFTKEEVLKDLWILKYSQSLASNRFEFIKKNNISTLKTWMVRCKEDILHKHIKRESENRDILGGNSMSQYLSEKLFCNENFTKNLIKKHPQLQNKSLPRIISMIELLCKNGFTPQHICKAPTILLHSTKTTEIRMKQLHGLGLKPDSLYVFTKSQRLYWKYVQNLLKTQSKTENESIKL